MDLSKREAFLLGIAALSFLLIEAPAMAESPFNALVWSDEFDGKILDYSKWECEVNAFGGGNQELQIYTDRKENVRVENGSLVLESRKDNAGIAGTVREFSSGRIRSKHRGDWKYGRFDIRAKLPAGQGLWPAIWLLPTDEAYGSWASSGEIDIVEFRGQNTKEVLGTIHFGSRWPKNKSTGKTYIKPSGNFVDDFHLFTVEWFKDSIEWFVDGVSYQRVTEWDSEKAPFPAPFDQPFHLVFNLAVGGQFVGEVSKDPKAFPAQLLVDYVRVYQ